MAIFVGLPYIDFQSNPFIIRKNKIAGFVTSGIKACGMAKPSSKPIDDSLSGFVNPATKASTLVT
ncbi:hypothetical protein SATRI_v1c12080 [Spiroplasma atrichopogonis]|nr:MULTISPECIES: hypothetical protein [Spiroplasma]AKM53546.1 hypothetical protein SATRI_v1c12080 [Spiroplasma atrichopogonis]